MVTKQPQDLQGAQSAQGSDLTSFGDILRDIAQEWNKAEAAIKQSEQIAGEVTTPAIFELRYAGRRMIDAFDEVHQSGAENKILALFEDARFCCHRAQHDAIDAAMAKIAIDLDNLTNKLGFEAVIHAYPDFRTFYSDFAIAKNKIAQSRGNRNNRNGIYQSITEVDLPELAKQHEQLMAVRPIAKWTALRLKMSGIWAAIVGLAAIAAAVFAGLSVDWSKFDNEANRPLAQESALNSK